MKNPIRLILSAFLLLTTARAGLAADLSEIFKDLGQATPSQLQIAASTQALGGATGPLYPSAQVEQNVIFEGDLLPVTNKSLAIFSDDGVDVYVDGLLIHSRHGKGQHLPNLAQSLHVLPIILKKNTSYHIKVVYSNILYRGDWDVDGCTLFAYNAPWMDLDVDNDGFLDYPDDGVENYQPGFAYQGEQQVLTPSSEQLMRIIVQDLVPGDIVAFKLLTSKTSRYPGICSNANSDGSYPAGSTDFDFILGDPNNNNADTTVLDVPVNGEGEADAPIKNRDMGGKAAVEVTVKDIANGQVKWQGVFNAPQDTDGDGLANFWEAMYANPGGGFVGFDRTKAQSVAGTNDGERDDDWNKSGIKVDKVGDNFIAFDEYRGFFVLEYVAEQVDAGVQGIYTVFKDTGNTVYRRLSPVVKDLFLESPDQDQFDGNAPLGYGLSHANDLEVHHLTANLRGADNTNVAGIVDFNGAKRQKRVLIKEFVKPVNQTDWITFGEILVPGAIPNDVRKVNEIEGANIYTRAILNSVMYVDSDGVGSVLPGFPPFNPNINFFGAFREFQPADKVNWKDTNGNGFFDKGDFLWVDNSTDDPATPQDETLVFGAGDSFIVGADNVGILISYLGLKPVSIVTVQNHLCWVAAFEPNHRVTIGVNQNRVTDPLVTVNDTYKLRTKPTDTLKTLGSRTRSDLPTLIDTNYEAYAQ